MDIKKIFIATIVLLALGFFSFTVFGAATIDPVNRYAWNDIVGWIDFYSTGTVSISSTALIGYADSSAGYIAFDCQHSPNPPADCGLYPNWKVINTNGELSGWAWNDLIGWISFNSDDTGTCPASSCYNVSFNGSDFSGWAWNDIIGWISFNCNNTSCTPVSYKVSVSGGAEALQGSLISSTYDTGISAGVVYNTIMYQGSKPTDTKVRFQLAVSNNPDGPWNFTGYDGTDLTYYEPIGPNVPKALNSVLYNNKRYFRYKVILISDAYQEKTPQVEKVIVNWSR